jgi:hypothetical protein
MTYQVEWHGDATETMRATVNAIGLEPLVDSLKTSGFMIARVIKLDSNGVRIA